MKYAGLAIICIYLWGSTCIAGSQPRILAFVGGVWREAHILSIEKSPIEGKSLARVLLYSQTNPRTFEGPAVEIEASSLMIPQQEKPSLQAVAETDHQMVPVLILKMQAGRVLVDRVAIPNTPITYGEPFEIDADHLIIGAPSEPCGNALARQDWDRFLAGDAVK